MRIIGGFAGGRRLKAPPGQGTRPTSDRVREAIFNILGPPAPDSHVLDLFAGSGGLGLEALSRGADRATFVERAGGALHTLRHNIASLELGEQCQVHRGDARQMLQRFHASGQEFDWVFVDPPYADSIAIDVLNQIGDSQLLKEHGTLIFEHDRRRHPDERYGSLIQSSSRRYGDTSVSFYERNTQ